MTASVCATTCDVSDARELDAFLQDAHRAFGRVDALVNNPSATAMADDDEAWAASFNVDMMPAYGHLEDWLSRCAASSIATVACWRSSVPKSRMPR